MPRPLALTLGEPAGIGPDLALAVWCRRAELGGQTEPGTRVAPERRGDGEFLADAGKRHFGAQLEHRKPAQEIGKPRSLPLDANDLALLDQKEIVQVLALRGQKRGVERALRPELLDVVGDEALQEGPAVGTGDLQDAAIIQQGVRTRGHALSSRVPRGRDPPLAWQAGEAAI